MATARAHHENDQEKGQIFSVLKQGNNSFKI